MAKSVKSILIALLILSLLLGLCACGNKEANAAEKLAGTYVLSKLTYADGVELTGGELKTELEEIWCMEVADTYLELRSDGTGSLSVYGMSMEIGWKDGYLWYSDFLDFGLHMDEDILEFDEDGVPIENTTVETTEPTIPEDLRIPFTVSGKTISLDPEGLGEIMEFTKQ